jgi:hypothetical protein
MTKLTKRYLTIGQINMMFDSCLIDDQLRLLKKALEIMSKNRELTKEECVAKAMGYSKTVSGSEYYEKEQLTVVSQT